MLYLFSSISHLSYKKQQQKFIIMEISLIEYLLLLSSFPVIIEYFHLLKLLKCLKMSNFRFEKKYHVEIGPSCSGSSGGEGGHQLQEP